MKNNITFLIDQIETGGAEKMIIRLANYFSESYNCHLFPAIDSQSLSNYDLSDIDLHVYKGFDEKIKISKFYNFFCWLFFLASHFRKIRPDVSISFLERSNVANIIICKLLNIKSVVSVRNNLDAQYSHKSPFIKKCIYVVLGFFYRRADVIVVVAEQLQEQLIHNLKLDKDKIKTIYNPQPLSKFSQLAKQSIQNKQIINFITNKKSVITVGRLNEQKGLHHLIRAFKFVLKSEPEAVLLILGEGPLKSSLDNLINEFQLDNHCKIFNYEKNPFAIVDKCDVFAFPSLWEGIANALLEAVAIGAKVVTTDCMSGPREILGYNLNSPQLLKAHRLAGGSIIPRLDGENRNYQEPLSATEQCLTEEIIYQLNYAKPHEKLPSIANFDEHIVMQKWNSTIELMTEAKH
ncbi:glycosyltransferase [Thalassotalea agariperforans]